MEMHTIIRACIDRLKPENSQNIAIIYGGAVDSKNIASFFAEPSIDGALVGGASLKSDEFARMANI